MAELRVAGSTLRTQTEPMNFSPAPIASSEALFGRDPDFAPIEAELLRLRQRGLSIEVSASAGIWVSNTVALTLAAPIEQSALVDEAHAAVLAGTKALAVDLRVAAPNGPTGDAGNAYQQIKPLLSSGAALTLQLTPWQASDSNWRNHFAGHATAVVGATRQRSWPEGWFGVPETVVRATCRALGEEPANLCLPPDNILLPRGAAPIVIALNVDTSSTSVNRELGAAIALADRFHDLVSWPSARLALDSFRNRRLTFIKRSTNRVGPFESQITEPLYQCSRELAAELGVFPAMQPEHVFGKLRGSPTFANWRKRWLDEVSGSHFRHRQIGVVNVSEYLSIDNRIDIGAFSRALSATEAIALGPLWAKREAQGLIPSWLRHLIEHPELAQSRL